MPGSIMTPSLAESWTLSPDQKTYEFKLRQGLKFHNGDPFTAEDVKFSFLRAKSARILKEKVRDVEIVDPYRIRFHLHEPFPDFMAFYGTLATGAGWVVPKKYVEKVGDDGDDRHTAVWPVDLRSRNQAEHLRTSRLTGRVVPRKFEFVLSLEPYPYDPAKPKKLRAEAGYHNGCDAGDLYPYPPYFSMGEAVGTNLTAVGIKTRMVTMERAAFQSAWLSKKLKGICVCIHAVYGNAASRMAEFVPSDGS